MPADRFILAASAVLQGAVALTFGLAFFGLWKGFPRPTTWRWTVAWLLYSVGVLNTAFGVAFGLWVGWHPAVQGLVSLPLLIGVLSFRAGTDALARRETSRLTGVVRVILAVAALVILARVAAGFGWIAVGPTVVPFVLPRLIMGLGYAWVAWPLIRIPASERPRGLLLMVTALVALAVRMLMAGGYELYQISQGAPQTPENQILTVAQVSLLIVFGVGTTVVLIDAERVEAQRAADTIRSTDEALRASEERFRFVVENTSDIQLLVGFDRRVRDVAPSCVRLLGVPPISLEGRDFLDLLHEDDRPAASNAFARMQADADQRRHLITVRLRERSGRWLTFDVIGQVAPRPRAEGPAILLSARDMTEQRRLEAALGQSQRLDHLGQMAGGIAHDFNNTLCAVKAAISLAAEETPRDSEAATLLATAAQATERGEALARQLLTFARRQEVTPVRFDVGARTGSLRSMLTNLIGRSITLSLNAEEGVFFVRADPTQFDQAILNLAINARDAMPKGGHFTVRIESRGVTGRDTTGVVRIDVEDTGHGIPQAVLSRIFEPFFTTKDSGRGTGLGLATVYGFTRQAGGQISIGSTEGFGTRFTIELPLDTTPDLAGSLAV